MRYTLHLNEKAVLAITATFVGCVLQYGPMLLSIPGISSGVQHDVGVAVMIAGYVAALLAKVGVSVPTSGTTVSSEVPT